MSHQARRFTLAGALLLAALALLVHAAAAATALYPAWTFKPIPSYLPPGVQLHTLLDLGEQGEIVIEYHSNASPGSHYGVVHNGVLTRMFGAGDPAPGGGSFVDLDQTVAYAASPSLVYITTDVNAGGQELKRTYRWNNGALTHLPTQANESFDLSRNDAHGKFISVRALSVEDIEFRITDGVRFSAPISLHMDSAFADPQTRQTLIGITADGAFLVHESIASGAGPCGGGWAAFQMRLFWSGSRSGNIVTSSGAANGCGGSGTNLNTPVMNSAGDILSSEYSYILAPDGTPQTLLTRLRLYPGDGGASSVVAQGEQVGNVGPYYGIEPRAITAWRQPIFMAQGGLPSASAKLYSGPNPGSDAFDGDFLAGFGQDGTPQNLYGFSENGYALVYALLANNSADFAIGRAATEFQWTNPAGGSWGDLSNWSTGSVPGSADEVLFGLAADYAVNFGSRDAGPVRVEAGFVSFNGAELHLLGPLSVSGEASFELASGKLKVDALSVGAQPPVDPANPLSAHVQIINPGTVLTGTTIITVGDAAPGSLTVEDAEVDSGPLSIGNDYAGSATLSGLGAQWFLTGGTAVGYKANGTLNIENGAYLRSNGEVIIGRGEALTTTAAVVEVRNLNAPPPSLGYGNWLILDTLTLGDFRPGELYIANSGQVTQSGAGALLQAGLRAHPGPGFDAFLSVDGSGDSAATPAMLFVDNDVLLGMADGAVVGANLNHGGQFEVSGSDLYLGFAAGSQAVMTVAGINSHDRPARLRVTRLAPLDFSHGICAIGESGAGHLLIHSGGQVECGTIRIGGQPGGDGYVLVDGANGGSTLYTEGGLCIGGDETGLCGGVETGSQGALHLKNSATVSAGRGTLIGPGGKLTGSGDIAVGVLGLYVDPDGVLDPGVNVLTPTLRSRALAPLAGIETGVLQISGTLTLSDSAQVKIDILGPDHYDQLVVSGAVQFNGGTLTLAFGNAYAPRQGDSFQFLLAGSLAGAFSQVQITGLQPGFQYDLEFSGGQLVLTALNDGVADSSPNYNIYLPLAVKGH